MNDDDFIQMSKITPEPTEWLWHERIPLGEITVLDGYPGDGKSGMTVDLAARVTTGRPMPDGGRGIKGGVLILTAEDSLTKTLATRLTAAGANTSRVWSTNRVLAIPTDLPIIERAVVRIKAKLIVVDPLMAFLAPNASRDQSVRQAMTPLKHLAERHNLAVVLIRHLVKSGSRLALYRGIGSVAIAAAARSALLVGEDPKDPNMRVLCHLKSNLGPKAPSLLFEPVAAAGTVAIRWHGICDYTADDLLKRANGYGEKLDDAKAFLLELLAEGPMAETEIEAKAAAIPIAVKTLRRAKDDLGIESSRQGGRHGCWVWSIPCGADSKDGQTDWASLKVADEGSPASALPGDQSPPLHLFGDQDGANDDEQRGDGGGNGDAVAVRPAPDQSSLLRKRFNVSPKEPT